MAQSFVQLNTDGTGKKADAWVTTTAGQYRQALVIGDPATDANVAFVTSFNSLQVAEIDGPPTSVSITAADSATVTTTGVNGQSLITGTPTASSAATFAISGDTTFMIEISGTFVGTVVFEKAVSSTQYVATGLELVGSTTSGVSKSLSSVTAPALLRGNAAGLALFRVRATAYTSGTIVVKAISGAGIVDVSIGSAGMISYSQTAPTTATWGTGTALNTALTQSTNGMSTAIVTSIETGTTTTAGALTFEVFDGTNWWSVTGQRIGSYTVESTYTLVNNTNVAWQLDIAGFQQFRTRLSTAITGTGTPQVVVIEQLQASSNSIAPTVGLAQKLDQVNDAVTAYPFGHTTQNITTNTTTTLKSGAGVFHGFTINNNGFTTAGTITIYDNTAGSGTKIGTYTIPVSPPGTALLATDLMPPMLPLDLGFTTGLTFVTATTAPAADITPIYR